MFDHEDECTYMFNWETKYACLDHPVDEECRVNHGGHRYDLSSLVKTRGKNDSHYLGFFIQVFLQLLHHCFRSGSGLLLVKKM